MASRLLLEHSTYALTEIGGLEKGGPKQ